MIDGISAITLATHDMQRAVRFYRALGFDILYGGEASSFTSFQAGTGYLNLTAQSDQTRWSWWGRVIFYVADVNAFYDRALAAGCQPTTVPRDAEWGNGTFISPTPMDTSSVSRGRCPLRHNSSATRTAG
jgi:catechol 2,3-dioxygenase-like lactoylglutathione lyase family enzyme